MLGAVHKIDCKMLKKELDLTDESQLAIHKLRSATETDKSAISAFKAIYELIKLRESSEHLGDLDSFIDRNLSENGVIHASVAILRLYIDSSMRTIKEGVLTLHRLSRSEACRDKLNMLYGGKLMVDILRAHPTHRIIVYYACGIINNLLVNDNQQENVNNQNRLAKAGAVKALLSVLKQFSSDPDIIKICSKALVNLLSVCKKSCEKFFDASGYENIEMLAKLYKQNADISYYLLDIIACLPTGFIDNTDKAELDIWDSLSSIVVDIVDSNVNDEKIALAGLDSMNNIIVSMPTIISMILSKGI